MNDISATQEAAELVDGIEGVGTVGDTSEPLTIFNAVVQKVDCKGQVLGSPFYRTNEKDIKTYLTGVIRSVVNIPRSQRFQFCATGFDSKSTIEVLASTTFKVEALALTERLLQCEIVAQKKIAGLNELREGSLLCAHFQLGEEECVILVKIDHAGYLDELTLQRTSGLPEKQRAQKCATFSIVAGKVDPTVVISDSNSSLTEYWWGGFLNLESLSNPQQNTLRAFKAIEGLLKTKVEKKSPSDYWTLRNAFVSYFTTRPDCIFDQMIDDIMSGYPAHDPDLDMAGLVVEAKELPKKKNFDSHFSIAPDVISNKIKRQIRLGQNLDLRITGEISDFDKTFDTGDDDGRKYLKIYSDEGYAAFNKGDGHDDIQKHN
ncbi:nucleoid-associated protein [Pseudomonas sp. ANT_J28]|uniref:nucleoid-associated protein n=1 Tax=Pseudomonas sp. ANT_J28 TaxID=2597352 RepID=UPI0011F1E188|nr:nucleoid-associated protein [Pseudomonas sp. ANT_J28]KAA0984818.1 nucleoid-associated protein [Pseudomonas sp. ANT_J28]